MLSPNDLEYIANDIVDIYSRLNERIIEDIARRLINAGTMTESARWQIKIAQETGMLYDNIVEMVSDNMEVSEKVVKQIFEDAAIESLEFDDSIYKKVGLNPIPVMQSENMLNILKAGIIKTNGFINNLCMTTASFGQDAFTQALDSAYFDITTGAFDYNTAIFNAIDKLSKDGMYVYYPSGYKSKIDVAVRKNIVTGISQTTGTMQLERAKELDTDLMEITAHEGARPKHEIWQGKIVSLSGKKGYLSLTDIGYNQPDGFKGINCRHDWFPFFEGISERAYTDKELKELNNQTVRYNDEDIKIYDARQMQRKMENEIREIKRELAGYNGILTSNPTINQELINETKSRFALKSVELKQKENILADFSQQTGLKRDRSRERINRFDKSVSQKVIISNRKSTNKGKDDIIDEKIPRNINDFYNYILKTNNKEDFITLKSNENGYITGQRLNSILGYDKLPKKVPSDKFEKLAKESEFGVLYRGISANTKEKCQEYIDKFRNGAFYSGGQAGHIYGKGTYTGFGELGKNTAYNYARQEKNGQVIEMILDKDAKTINYYDLFKETNKEVDEFIKNNYKKYNINNYFELISNLNKIKKEDEFMTQYILNVAHDTGYSASIKGYDAIIANNELAGQKYIVILNRGKVILNE